MLILDSVKEYVWHLYGKDKIMKIMAVLAFNWFVNGATYYGLTLASGDIGIPNHIRLLNIRIFLRIFFNNINKSMSYFKNKLIIFLKIRFVNDIYRNFWD